MTALLSVDMVISFNDKTLGLITDVMIQERADQSGAPRISITLQRMNTTDDTILNELRFDLSFFEITNKEKTCGFKFTNPQFVNMSISLNANDKNIYTSIVLEADYMYFFASDPLEDDVNNLINVIKTNQAKEKPVKQTKKKKTKKVK